jgi:spore germination protein GerM
MKHALIFTGLIALGIMVGGMMTLAGMAVFSPDIHPPDAAHSVPAGGMSRFRAESGFLYFADPAGRYLVGERRRFSRDGTLPDRMEQIVSDLIRGPHRELLPTLPPETRLRAAFAAPDRLAVVDFSQEIHTRHPGGVTTEMLTLFSIVNSLVLNLPEIDRVKILIDGRETLTLAGHLDITGAHQANMMLIR